jgi:hypothetical protein
MTAKVEFVDGVLSMTVEVAPVGHIKTTSLTTGGAVGEALWWSMTNCAWTSHRLEDDGSCKCGAIVRTGYFDADKGR